MMTLSKRLLVLAAFVLIAVSFSAATTLSGNLTADNGFYAYISTDNSQRGSLLAWGDSWETTYSFTDATLSPGVTNYLHIEAFNWYLAAAFIGQFSLTGSGFRFANGAQTLLTDSADWSGIYNDAFFLPEPTPAPEQPWVLPTSGVVTYGQNGVGPRYLMPLIDSSAQWIWPNDPASACEFCVVDLSTPIYSTIPEPTALDLSCLALAAICLKLIRRAPGQGPRAPLGSAAVGGTCGSLGYH